MLTKADFKEAICENLTIEPNEFLAGLMST